MAPTRTVKNKHAANKSGVKNSRAAGKGGSGSGSGGGGATPIVKSKRNQGKLPASQLNSGRSRMLELLQKRRRQRTYTDKELDIPKLNTITPAGVQKPKGKKKGKVFVDDRESMTTILAMVQAEKEGQIESKIMKARQLEEIRAARLAEAEKKEEERQSRLDETKASLRKKRKRPGKAGAGAGADGGDADVDSSVRALSAAGTRAVKAKKKRVSFAGVTE